MVQSESPGLFFVVIQGDPGGQFLRLTINPIIVILLSGVAKMPRTARKKSKTGVYHLILRGINRQTIFEDDEDASRFLETFDHYKNICGYVIYAYCLMGNHIHMLIKEGREELGKVMKRIGVSYVYWYNYKYERSGHLFQGRYRSEIVEDERYLLTVLRYIHQNPLKAKMVESVKEYRWSSYHEYIAGNSKFVDCNFILKLFDDDSKKALTLFENFHEQVGREECLEVYDGVPIKDDEAIKIIKDIFDVISLKDIQKESTPRRNECLRTLKEKGLSTRQIARLTGVPRYIILKS